MTLNRTQLHTILCTMITFLLYLPTYLLFINLFDTPKTFSKKKIIIKINLIFKLNS
jgi:hypothetical protein